MTYEALYTAIENALCDGGEEQHDVHVTHADKAARVVESLAEAGFRISRDSSNPIALDDADKIRVTATDLKTGKSETAEIENDYVLITAGSCYQDGLSSYATGTRVLTIKGRRGL